VSMWKSKHDNGLRRRFRYDAVAVTLLVLPFFLFACGTETKKIEHYGGWDIEPFNYTFQVFIIRGNAQESDVRSSADSLSLQYLESFETVELVFTPDVGLAEELAGSDTRNHMLRGSSSFDPGKLMLHGGAWYRRDKSSDRPEWLFYPEPPGPNP